MPLLSLPAELLLVILRFIGPQEFQQDTRRLLISQKWYSLARIILLDELYLTVGSFKGRAKTRRSLAAHNYPGVQCRGLTMFLENCDETLWRLGENKFTYLRQTPLNISLERLAKDLGRRGKLRTLKFEASRPQTRAPTNRDGMREQPKRKALLTSSILGFLDLNLAASLKTLHLDLANFFRRKHATNGAHYCLSIAKLLPSLLHARIRLPRICPDCFGAHVESSQKQEGFFATSRLRTLAVCVSVGDELHSDHGQEFPLSCVYAHCCRAINASGVEDPPPEVICEPSWTRLLESLRSLARRSPRLEMARLLHHPTPSSSRRLVAFDCLAGKEHMVDWDDDWNAEFESDKDGLEDELENRDGLVKGEISSLVSD